MKRIHTRSSCKLGTNLKEEEKTKGELVNMTSIARDPYVPDHIPLHIYLCQDNQCKTQIQEGDERFVPSEMRLEQVVCWSMQGH